MSSVSLTSSEEREKTRPRDTPFLQQRMPARSPTYTSHTFIVTSLMLSLFFFLPMGIALLVTNAKVTELVVDYTDCDSLEFAATKCAEVRDDRTRMTETCTCEMNIATDETASFNAPLSTLFYGLENFYQNQRGYLKSRDDRQLHGLDVSDGVDKECEPYHQNQSGSVIAPCGLIATSIFNDTFELRRSDTGTPVSIQRTEITRERDKGTKFRNPPVADGSSLSAVFAPFARPSFWQNSISELDTSDPGNNGFLNEALIVWMRSAAFPVFRKKYGRPTDNIDAATNYILRINYNYPVSSYNARKRFIISNDAGWLEGKSNFLAICYLVMAVFLFVFAMLVFAYRKFQIKQRVRRVASFSLSFSDD